MKWLGFLRVLPHPALLPLSISTFITIAGPGGFAEISHHAPAVANLPTTFDAPLVVAPPSQPMVLVLHPVPPQTPPDVAGQPTALPLDPQLTADQNGPATPTSPVNPETLQTQIPEVAPATPPDHDEGTVPEAPPAPPTDTDDETAPPPADEPDGDETGDDTGVPDDDGNGNDDGASDDEPLCDPPGTGPEPQGGVPPGHDQNGNDVDDRCEDNANDDGAGDDTGTGDDTGNGDSNDDGDSEEPVCDPPGTGPEPHNGVPPGHDRNEDGIDDRCQDGTGDDGAGSGDDASGTGDDSSSDADQPVCDTPGTGPEPHGGVPPGHDKNDNGIDDRCE